ncbi:MAG: N-acetylmuramoyl-L-alanine amidase [bacterium]
MKNSAFLLLSLLFPVQLFGQLFIRSEKDTTFFLRIIVPEKDTVRTGAPRYRVSASTTPTAKAFINEKEVKVYASGAFAGFPQIGTGASTIRLTVISAAGDSLTKEFIFVRPEAGKSIPRDPVTINAGSVSPSQDLWLGKDDILEVSFKGSAGYDASFSIDGVESGIPMKEQSEGMYIGRYQMKETDEAKEVPIKVRLRKSFWSSEVAYSKGKVSLLPQELPRVAEITGRRPFLNAGLGADRLGGAKLGFLSAGVKVVVTGKTGRQYRVRLSESMSGWLPEDFAKLLPIETPLPRSLVGSILVTGSGGEDIITVSLSQRLLYLSDQVVEPAAIIVDIFGATSNTNWITHHLTAKGIESVIWDQVGTEHYRLSISLASDQHWGYDVGYDAGTTLRIRVRRPPLIKEPDQVLKGMIFAVDAGHGGNSDGALGSTGVREKDVNMAIVRHLDSLLLQRGAKVVLTRSNDSDISMATRTDTIINSGARILISVHCNSIGETSNPETVNGTSTYYRHLGFKTLADIMYGKMLSLGLDQFGVVGSFNFSLSAPTQLPNVLVETAFLSNPEDEMKLLNDGFRRSVAEKIVEGLEEFILASGIR